LLKSPLVIPFDVVSPELIATCLKVTCAAEKPYNTTTARQQTGTFQVRFMEILLGGDSEVKICGRGETLVCSPGRSPAFSRRSACASGVLVPSDTDRSRDQDESTVIRSFHFGNTIRLPALGTLCGDPGALVTAVEVTVYTKTSLALRLRA